MNTQTQLVQYRLSWSNNIDNTLRDDFLIVENAVFGNKMTYELFEKKYINNIYGPSVIVVAYIDGLPVGADALWRNDICGNISYQSVDTCVLPCARGRHIFSGMVKRKLEMIDDKCLVYGFPNINSINGFTKMGWVKCAEMYPTLLLPWKKIPTEKTIIDYEYAKWWFSQKKYYLFTIKKQNKYWLVARRGLFFYSILGEICDDLINFFPRVKYYFALLYKDSKKKIYNRNYHPTRVICINHRKCVKIPLWKIDSI